MKGLVRWLYSRYCLAVFAIIFLIFFPFFWLSIQFDGGRKFALRLNHWWATWFWRLSFIPVKQIYKAQLDPSKQYVFCANHSSFLDIPLMGLCRNPFVFVGKSSLSKVPLFGYVFAKVHITVNRSSMKSKYASLQRAAQAIDQHISLVMFPEGGTEKNPPQLEPFKDGAFRLAIEKQIPIVPVTIPYNWIILPSHQGLMVNRRTSVAIYHKPLPTEGLSLKDQESLKGQVTRIIKSELLNHHPYGNQSGDVT
jgi:1-acyl-sn-glycerol-3-phosphate acyltransferase